MNLFDLADEAIARAEAHANEEWSETFYKTICLFADEGLWFTSAEVCAAMPDDVSTHEPRAIGAVLRRAKRNGLIATTDHYRQTGSHGRPQRVWRPV